MPDWSPDGRYLAFCSAPPAAEGLTVRTVLVWDRLLDKSREIMQVDECITGTFHWARDSQRIFIRAGTRPAAAKKVEPPSPPLTTSYEPVLRNGAAVRVITAWTESLDQSPVSDPWDISASYDLVLADIAGGPQNYLLTNMRIGAFWVAPNGGTIAVAVRKRFAQPGSQQLLYDLGELNVSTREFRVLAVDVELGPTPFTVSWSPDGKFLAYRSAGMSSKGDLFVVALATGRPQNLTLGIAGGSGKKGFAGSVVQLPLWEEDGRSLLFAANGTLWKASLTTGQVRALAHFPGKQVETIRRGSNLIWSTGKGTSTIVIARDEQTEERSFHRVNLASGEQAELFSGQFDVDSPINMFAPEGGDSVFYVAESSGRSSDLWAFCADGGEPRPVTHINPEIDRYKMGSSRIVEWRSLDGERLHGALLLPSTFEAGKRVPLVVGVYGGHFLSADGQMFGFGGCVSPMNAQLLATRGYAVLCPDAPQTVGSPMLDLAKTVLPGVNELINLGIADPDRLGIMGQSYGGYSVLCLIVQTHRFKAAVMSGGFGDLFADYGSMDEHGNSFGIASVEKGQGLMGGTPWDFRDRYLENSPFFYLDRVETPLLILHGSNDTMVPGFLAEQVFVGLRRLRKTVSYAQYPGEGHSAQGWAYENEKDYLKRVLNWFATYLQSKN
jgi:dipeptidyl aminopeptidase/acylaminoacyl peptidase